MTQTKKRKRIAMKRWSLKVERTSNKKVFMKKRVKVMARTATTRRRSLTTRKPRVTMLAMAKLRKVATKQQQSKKAIKKQLPSAMLLRKTTT